MPSGQGGRPLFLNLLISLRPGQWTKNLFVFAALVFAQELDNPDAVLRAVVAFAVFCALSGAVYLVNDVFDRDQDQQHPLKKHRPIASGFVSPNLALTVAAVLSAAALAVAFALGRPFFTMAAAYLALISFYSAFLKHIVILDVLTIAARIHACARRRVRQPSMCRSATGCSCARCCWRCSSRSASAGTS